MIKLSPKRSRYWYCIIGPVPDDAIHPMGDGPPHAAVKEAVYRSTGLSPSCASGWIEAEDAAAMREANHVSYCARNGMDREGRPIKVKRKVKRGPNAV